MATVAYCCDIRTNHFELSQLHSRITPWQRVYARFGFATQAEFGRAFGWDRSKISRALSDKEGLINGRDQKQILKVAQARGVEITAADLVP